MKLPSYRLKKAYGPLVGFSGDLIPIEGEVTLLIIVWQVPHLATVRLIFLIVNIPLVYNIILGWSNLSAFWAIISTYHLLIRFPINNGVSKIRGDQILTRLRDDIGEGPHRDSNRGAQPKRGIRGNPRRIDGAIDWRPIRGHSRVDNLD